MPMVRKKVRSALPLYIAAAAWAVCALIFPMYKLVWLAVAVLVAAGAYIAARLLCREREVTVYEPEKPAVTGDRAVDDTLSAASRQLDSLEAAAGRVSDPGLRDAIARMVSAGRRIIAEAARRPEKLPRLRRFLGYYLPTAVKVIDSYVHMKSEGVEGRHSSEVVEGVERNAGQIASAFEAQLDSLYADEALDISTDLEVLERMLNSDGLTR